MACHAAQHAHAAQAVSNRPVPELNGCNEQPAQAGLVFSTHLKHSPERQGEVPLADAELMSSPAEGLLLLRLTG
jgi:hypothetical protein